VQEEDMPTTVGITQIVLGVLTAGTLNGIDRTFRRFLQLGLGRRVVLAPAKSLPWLLLLVVVSGCASQQQFLDQIEPTALSAAQNRAQFELNCPNVTTSILSRKMIQPVWVRGIPRAEYTIGVSGCGQRSVYMAICPDASDCNAFAQTGRIIDSLN
jgi:hypothetical protein